MCSPPEQPPCKPTTNAKHATPPPTTTPTPTPRARGHSKRTGVLCVCSQVVDVDLWQPRDEQLQLVVGEYAAARAEAVGWSGGGWVGRCMWRRWQEGHRDREVEGWGSASLGNDAAEKRGASQARFNTALKDSTRCRPRGAYACTPTLAHAVRATQAWRDATAAGKPRPPHCRRGSLFFGVFLKRRRT